MKKTTLLISLVLVITTCKKEHFEIHNLNGDKIGVLGHGGMGIGHAYPMNSIESILSCLSLGADGTEIDVQMTKDSVLVAFHDKLLEHATNMSGSIYEKNWDEISGAHYKNGLYTEYKLVTLDDIFSNIPDTDHFTFFLDCQDLSPDVSETYINRFNNALIRFLEKFHLENKIYVELRRNDLIRSLRLKKPDLKIFVYSDAHLALETVDEYKLQGIAMDVNNVSKEDIKKAHNSGIMISVFNAHTKERNIDAINKNVDFIESDDAKNLIKLLR